MIQRSVPQDSPATLPREIETPQGELLSRREIQIVYGLLDGGRVATLAQSLSLSKETIRHYLKSIFQKFGVHSQAELLAELKRSDWQQLPALFESRQEMAAFIEQANQRLLDQARQLVGQDFDLVEMMTRVVIDALPVAPSALFEWKVRFKYLAVHNEPSAEGEPIPAPDETPQAKATAASRNILAMFAAHGVIPQSIDVDLLNDELLDLIRSVAFRLLSNTGLDSQSLDDYVRRKVERLIS